MVGSTETLAAKQALAERHQKFLAHGHTPPKTQQSMKSECHIQRSSEASMTRDARGKVLGNEAAHESILKGCSGAQTGGEAFQECGVRRRLRR